MKQLSEQERLRRAKLRSKLKAERAKNRYHSDPEYAAHIREMARANYRKRREDPDYSDKYREKAREKYKRLSKDPEFRERCNTKSREYHRKNRDTLIDKMRNNRLANLTTRREYDRLRYQKNRDARLKLSADDRRNNPDKFRDRRLRKVYGISLNDYETLLKKQNGRCAICRRPATDFKRKLAVDHCHKTGRIRGLLCAGCNAYLGRIQDSKTVLLRTIEYLTPP